MAEQFELTARVRARSGTHLVRRLRREGDVPAVIYGGDKPNLSIAINHDLLYHSLQKEEFRSAIIVINTDGEREEAILRDVQKHPYKINILHADFQRVDQNQALTMMMPITYTGEDNCLGVRIGGGVISHLINDVEIVCLPRDLPEHIELDVSGLDINDSFHLSDITLPQGVQFTAFLHDNPEEHDLAVVTVLPPKVEVESAEGAAGGEQAESATVGETRPGEAG